MENIKNRSNKIFVLHLITSSSIAGAENIILTLAEGMKGSQFQSEICTLSPEGDLHKKAEQIGITAYALGYKNILSLPKVFIKLILLLHKNKYDILNTHLFHASVAGALVGKILRIPNIVITRHYSSYIYRYGTKFEQWLDKLSVNKADQIIAVSNAVKEVLINIEGINEDKITTIYNGINIDKFSFNVKQKEQIRKTLNIEDKIVLLFTGHLRPGKGHQYLLETIAKIKNKYPDIVLLLVGEGILRDKLNLIIKQLHIEQYIRFLGYRADLPHLLSATDIYVHSSVDEGFGIAIIEAMAAGLPVIATNVGGIPEIITHNENGVLVPAEDSKAFADAIDDLIKYPDKRKILADKGKQHVEAMFTYRVMVKRYMEFYLKIINHKPH